MHRAAPVDRPAVPVDPHHVDVAATNGDALVEDLRSFVDHRVEQPLQDLLIGDLALFMATVDGELPNHLLDLGVGCGGPGLRVVAVIAHAVLLAAAPAFAHEFAHRRRGALLCFPADVEAGEITHRERAHREAELEEHVVDLGGGGALHQHAVGFGAAHEQHAVADEAVADPHHHADLADPLADRHRRGDHGVGRRIATHVLEEFHHIGRREEVHTDHRLGAAGDGGDLVDIEGRGVRRHDRPGLTDPIEFGEDRFLELHVLEDGLDDDVAVGEVVLVGRASDQAHALLDGLGRDRATARRPLVVLAHDTETSFERGLVAFNDRDRDAGVGEVHRNAAAHGAGAEHTGVLNVDRGRVLGDIGDLVRLAFGEEGVALRSGLGAGHELHEERGFHLGALIERQAGRGLDAPDVVLRGEKATGLAGDLRTEVGEDLGVDIGDLIIAITHLHQRQRFRDGPLGERDRRSSQRLPVPIHDLVDQAVGRCFGGGQVTAGGHCLEGLGHADQSRQTLCPTGTGQETDVDLGKAVLR